ncbi:MAG: fimbrillin family protein [Alistipes sp.]|nr:fimbrillin family protein [Alistipes sp.]
MKKFFTYFLLTLLAASCTSEQTNSALENGGKIEVSIGQSAKIQSRTLIAEDGYSARWSGGDQIALWAADESGNIEMEAAVFNMHHFSHNYQTAIFKSLITPLTGSSYTYYATCPAPKSVSGTTATFTLPAVQNGTNAMGVRDIMVATPAQGAALTEGVTADLGLRFSHKMHALRIVLPSTAMSNGREVSHIVMKFPTAVVGDVVVDVTNPQSPTTLQNGTDTVTIQIPEGYAAGDYLWVMIHPTTLSGEISYTAYSGEYMSVEKVISLDKSVEEAHISPMSIPVPEPEPATTIYLDVTENNLGEDFNTLSIIDENGAVVRTFTPNAANRYTIVINGEIDASYYTDKTFTFRYDSENAIVEDKVTFNGFVAYGENNFTSKVPYLLFEDFECITTESKSNGDNNYASDDRSQPGVSLDNIMCTPGWNAARYWTKGHAMRINTRAQCVKIVMPFASSHYGRLDTPQLKNLKSGKTVNLKLQFDAGGNKHSKSLFTVNSIPLAVATHTNSANPIDGIPTGKYLSGLSLKDYETTLADYGTTIGMTPNLGNTYGEDAFGETYPTFEMGVPAATSATRLVFYPAIDCDNSKTGNAEINIYIDNIRVSIAK